jgi:hypothetical protein
MRVFLRGAALTLTGLLLVPAAATLAADDQVVIQVSAVRASNAAKSFDPRLQEMKPELKRLRFKSYQLLSAKSHSLSAGDQCGIELPGGRYLHVTVVERTPQALKLRVLINENNHPVVSTDVKLNRNSILLLGGPRDAQGTLIVAIGATDAAPPKAATAGVQ